MLWKAFSGTGVGIKGGCHRTDCYYTSVSHQAEPSEKWPATSSSGLDKQENLSKFCKGNNFWIRKTKKQWVKMCINVVDQTREKNSVNLTIQKKVLWSVLRSTSNFAAMIRAIYELFVTQGLADIIISCIYSTELNGLLSRKEKAEIL